MSNFDQREKLILKEIENNFVFKEIVDDEFKVEVIFETTWKTFRIICFLMLFVVFLYFIKPSFAISNSMYPTINTNDYMFFKNKNKNINRGDIISFISPYNNKEVYVKRVMGLPGEIIEIKNEKIYINSVPLENENYISMEGPYRCYENIEPFKISENSYYVLGDNRYNSADSRVFGEIKENKIKGKLLFNIPFGKFIYIKKTR